MDKSTVEQTNELMLEARDAVYLHLKDSGIPRNFVTFTQEGNVLFLTISNELAVEVRQKIVGLFEPYRKKLQDLSEAAEV